MSELTLRLGYYAYFISAYHSFQKMSIEFSNGKVVSEVWRYNPRGL